MKKLLLLPCCLLLPFFLFAQLNFGVKLGTCLSGFEEKSSLDVHPEYKNMPGIQGGIFFSQKVSTALSVQPELLLSLRGSKAELSEDVPVPQSTTIVTVGMESKFLPLYLDFPVYLKGSISTGTKMMTLGMGPIVSYGLSGKLKVNAESEGMKVSGEQKLFERDEFVWTDDSGNTDSEVLYDKAILKRFDYGLSAFGGWEFNSGLMVNVGFQFGLKNISNDSDEKLYTRTLTFGAGYKF